MLQRSFRVLMVLFLALTWLVPVQTVSAAATDTATFTFTTSFTPAPYGSSVTFTLSATGTNATYAPFGYVTFYSDAAAIAGCAGKSLNYSGGPTAGIPATCTTSGLPAGVHVITASFDSLIPSMYADETVTLTGGQTVQDPIPLTILPETLPNATWHTGYSQTFTASGGSGTTLTWKSEGLPDGMSFNTSTGVLSGAPTEISSHNVTISVSDNAGGLGSRAYTLNINPQGVSISLGGMGGTVNSTEPISIPATVNSYDLVITPQPTGTLSYLVDGVAVTNCTGLAETPNNWTFCSFLPTGLTAGDHTVRVDYTPDANAAGYYAPSYTVGTLTLTVPNYTITGMLYEDKDNDGDKDSAETYLTTGQYIELDINCDGTMDAGQYSKYFDGTFDFGWRTSGLNYCLKVTLDAGYFRTTTLNPFTLDANKNFEIGIYHPQLTFSPISLPNGDKNVPYSQTITVSGGTAPYSISNLETSNLPAGLTFDAATMTVSGTVTTATYGSLSMDVTDAGGIVTPYSSMIFIQTDGTFTLVSSKNPADSGEELTFTLSASGDAVIPSYDGAFPPVGSVTFLVDDVEITGCVDVSLNLDGWNPGNYPAVCTTTLSDGTHEIDVVYDASDENVYHSATRSITQVVGGDKTAPEITPNVTGTLGDDGWYTSDVSLTWTVVDAESPITSQTGCDPVSITSDQAATTYTCSAVSAGGTNSVDAVIKRDATKPVTMLSGVQEGAIYAPWDVPATSCSSTDSLSGVAVEASLKLSGGDANGLGSITATCSGAKDAAANLADPTSVTYTVALPADLKVNLVDNKDAIKPGSNLVYLMTVTNLGPRRAASITVTANVDPLTRIVSVSKPKGWNCSVQTGQVTCTGSSLNSGATAIFKITVSVNRTARPGTILTSTADVTGSIFDDDSSNNTITQRTRVIR